jgi:M-phase inducer tyrosine phosphatase
MFEHPGDVMKAEKDREECARPCLDSIMDVDEGHQLHLPNFVPEDKPDSLPRVNQETMNAVLDGEYKSHYDQVLVIDCRFEYEYNGGHINGAQNFNDKEQLCRQLFDPASINAKTLIVLHCEYSAHRAPLM